MWMVVLLCLLLSVSFAESFTQQQAKFSGLKLSRFAFGSCAKGKEEEGKHSVFDTVSDWNPQVFVLAGDAVYNDKKFGPLPGMFKPSTLPEMRANFADRAAGPAFSRLTQKSHLLAIWDDHDYGLNDADGSLPFKEASREVFLEFAREPKDSPRWTRNGIYASYSFDNGRVKIVLLDVRFNKTTEDILGEEQWVWLENELAESKSEITFIVSPIQVLVLDRPLQEKFSQQWSSYVRLAKLIGKTPGVIVLSGDIHMSSFLRSDCGFSYNVTEFTSSGLTHSLVDNFWTSLFAPFVNGFLRSQFEIPNHPVYVGKSFGGIEIDWIERHVKMSILDATTGSEVQSLVVQIDSLRPQSHEGSFASCAHFARHRFRMHWSEVLQLAVALSGVFAIGLGVFWYCQCEQARRTRAKKRKGS